MKFNIESENDNKLLDRKEVKATVSFDGGTPSRSDIKELIGSKLGVNRELMVLREVNEKYGLKKVDVVIHVYKDAQTLKRIEPGYLQKRDTKGKSEEAPKEEAKKEVKQEKKEEAKKN